MSDGLEGQSPWLSEFSEYYDPHRVNITLNLSILVSILKTKIPLSSL